MVQERDKEVTELKSKFTEAMALNHMMPTTSVNGVDGDMSSSPLYTSKFNGVKEDNMILNSNLNPNASEFTHKTSM